MLLIIQGCAKDKCIVCNDYNGIQNGIKCFHTVNEALQWQAIQDSANPNKPLDCNK